METLADPIGLRGITQKMGPKKPLLYQKVQRPLASTAVVRKEPVNYFV